MMGNLSSPSPFSYIYILYILALSLSLSGTEFKFVDMEVVECEFEFEFEFWPIEHPSEPLDEDRPLKCPISHSPSLTNQKETCKNMERGWKRAEKMEAEKPGKSINIAGVRKRHHELTQGEDEDEIDHHQDHNVTIFNMLHHFNKFESSSSTC